MTVRSVILGLLAAIVICGVTFFNDMVMDGTHLVGNYVPVSVFGGLLLFVLLANPLLGLISKGLRLKGRELAVAAAIVLFACYVPGRGLMHYFTTLLMVPHHHQNNRTDWQGGPARIEKRNVRNWPALVVALQDAMAREDAPLTKAVERLSPELRAGLNSALKTEAAATEDQDAIRDSFNALLKDKALAQSELPPGIGVPQHVRVLRAREPASLSDEDVAKLNRGVLEMWAGKSLRRRKPGLVEGVPSRMLADVSQDSEQPKKFMSGLTEGREQLRLDQVPWHLWTRTLIFWVPLILSISLAVIALAVIVHRQWSSHEHLPYPTIEFARALLPAEDGSWSAVFRSRLFWTGALAVLIIYLNNYLGRWWPGMLIPVRTSFDFRPLVRLFPAFERGGGMGVATPALYFTAIGFAYFLSSEVSLSLGIGPFLFFAISGTLAGYGVAVSGGMWNPSDRAALHAGAYFGLFLCLIYAGRHYYLTAFGRSLCLPTRDRVESHVTWACRVFLVSAALFVVQLTVVGVDWQMAVLYLLGTLVIYVVISRLLAEAGVFFIHAYFFPCAVLWGALGAEAAGPGQLLILGMVSALLVSDPREALMPFVVSGLRLADGRRTRLGSVATWGCVALLIGLVVAIPVTLYLQYQHGASKTGDGWTIYAVPSAAFVSHKEVQIRLTGQDRMATAESISGWRRFTAASPQRRPVIAFAITFAGVLLFAFLRRRFVWWPLHPIVFVVLGTYQSNTMAFSFLLGWLLKVLVVRYGGGKLYLRLKPLVIGLIAGEMLGAVIPVMVGTIYYLVTGRPPMPFRIMP